MDADQKAYKLTLNLLNQAIKNVNIDLSSYRVGDIEIFAKNITEAFHDFKLAYQKLVLNADETAEAQNLISEVNGEFNGTNEITVTLQRKLANYKDSLLNHSTSASVNTGHKLPPLKGLKFSGLKDSVSYGIFWANFSTLVDKTSLTPTSKFLHLLDNLEGPALKLVVSLKVSDENYKKAVQLLSERFDRPDAVVNHLIQKILTLKPSAECDRSFSNIETYINEIRTAVADLELYEYSFEGKTVEKILGSLVFSNLPYTIRQFLVIKSGEIFPSYNKIIEFYPDTLEMLKSKVLDNHKPKKIVCQVSSPKPLAVKHPKPSAAKNTPVNSGSHKVPEEKIVYKSSPKPSPTCKFCGETDHVSTWCPKFPSIAERKTQLNKIKKCTVCMSANHLSGQCKHVDSPFDFPCFICKTHQHISPLCPELKLKQ